MLLAPSAKYTFDGIEHQISPAEKFLGEIPTLTPEKIIFLTRLKRVVQHFVTVCEEHHITYYLSCGSLLGAVKVNGILIWDNDADVCVPLSEVPKLKVAFRNTKKPFKFLPFLYGYKLCVDTILGFPFLDVMIVAPDPYYLREYGETHYAFCYPLFFGKPTFALRRSFPRKHHPESMIFPLQQITFEGISVWAPHDPIAFCVQNYGTECLTTSFVKPNPKRWLTALLRI